MIVKSLPVGPMLNRCYLIVCEDTRQAALVDPAWEEDTLLRELKSHKACLQYLLCTHGHGDHVNLVPRLLEIFPEAKAVFHPEERISAPKERSVRLADGDRLTLGNIEIFAMHTPGHTPGSVTYLAGTHAFFGDTIFCGEDCGRVDFYRDGPADMVESLRKIRQLPDHLTVCSGHTYGAYETTTMKFEKEHNAALKCKTLEEFLEFKS